MLAKSSNFAEGDRVTKPFLTLEPGERRNSMDEAYTGNRLAHREIRTLPNGCIWTAP